MALKLITAPAAEPLTTTEAKTHLKVDFADDDTYISALITAARVYCEKYQNRAYITQTWEMTLDDFPREDIIKIPLPPLQSITSIKYYDTSDTEATFASTNYYVDTYSHPGRVSLNYALTWPTTTLRPINSVIVKFIAGYGATGASVPQEVIHAMKLLIADWYERRTPFGDEMPVGHRIKSAVSALLWLERLVPI